MVSMASNEDHPGYISIKHIYIYGRNPQVRFLKWPLSYKLAYNDIYNLVYRDYVQHQCHYVSMLYSIVLVVLLDNQSTCKYVIVPLQLIF